MARGTKEGGSGKSAGEKSAAGKSAGGRKSTAGQAGTVESGARNNALAKPLKPSKELAAIVGTEPLSRPEVVKRLWEYIKKNDLQNPQNKREIVGDDKLKKVFGQDKATMFEMNKLVSKHLSS